MKERRTTICLLVLALCCTVAPAGAAPQTLYLYNWSQYMNPDILQAFEKKYDVEIVRGFYASNPELFAKLRAGGDHQYDVIFPSSYYVPRLIKTGLIQPLDTGLIPNYGNLIDKFEKPSYDPGGKYTAAYQYGTTGILYNTEVFPDPPKSWSFVFDPVVNPSYPFSLMPDAAVTLSMACAYLGYGYPCESKNEWISAAKLVKKAAERPNFNGFLGGTPVIQRVARGNSKIAITYGGDFYQRQHKDPDLYADMAYFIPKEGSEIWIDVMAIPAHAPHPELANKFINFVLSAKMGAKLSNFTAYPSPNKAAQPYLAEYLRQEPVKITDDELQRVHITPALAGKQLMLIQELWTTILSK